MLLSHQIPTVTNAGAQSIIVPVPHVTLLSSNGGVKQEGNAVGSRELDELSNFQPRPHSFREDKHVGNACLSADDQSWVSCY